MMHVSVEKPAVFRNTFKLRTIMYGRTRVIGPPQCFWLDPKHRSNQIMHKVAVLNLLSTTDITGHKEEGLSSFYL